jgi:hypothetical protein
MTTLCLCDWVETREDKALRLSIQDGPQSDHDSDLRHRVPVLLAWPALPDWPSVPSWPDALAWTMELDTPGSQQRP